MNSLESYAAQPPAFGSARKLTIVRFTIVSWDERESLETKPKNQHSVAVPHRERLPVLKHGG